MAGRPPTDPDLVAEALRRIAAGKHRDDVAAELTAEGRPISVATIRRAQAAQKGSPPAGTAPAPPATRRPAKAPGRPAEEPKALPPPPAPIPLLPDTIDDLRAALEQTKGQLFALAGRQGYAAAGNLYDKLLKTMAAVERERQKPGAELSVLLGKGAGAVTKIRAGAQTLRRQEAKTGCCARCAGRLSEERVQELRELFPDVRAP